MKLEEINIRDPYILAEEKAYYLYGTRSNSCWGEADGFDCYISQDKKEWQGPFEIFKRPKGFFADRNYWAPECYFIKGYYYLVTTFGSADKKKGIYILRANSPEGPFELYSRRITPKYWSSIDGTLYMEKGNYYLIFSHSFEDCRDGDMCIMKLADDLKEGAEEPRLLFSAKEALWAKPIPFAKEEFGIDGEVYLSDGPSLFGERGKLYMVWSSWGRQGYAVGAALSESGSVYGPWKQQKPPVFPENGGHAMVFKDWDKQYKLMLHYPNDKYKERPCIFNISIEEGIVSIKKSDKRKG